MDPYFFWVGEANAQIIGLVNIVYDSMIIPIVFGPGRPGFICKVSEVVAAAPI